ncbi:MAG: DNA repair protein RadC [Rhodospirillaceae bacterium]|nr:DNA repair protein RadC [Rhodospirillaceae bacterium]
MNPLDATEAGFGELPLLDVPAAPVSVREAARRRRLQGRLLRAGREAVDDRELLELLLSGRRGIADSGEAAAALLAVFGTAPRALAARPDRLRSVPGLSDDAIAVLKAAEALGIAMAREAVPDAVRPSLASYDRVIDYCRTLAGHREVEQFHLLFLNRKNRLLASELHQHGSVCHAPVYPREVCIRALELQASAVIATHAHPSGDPEPSRADIDMTKRIKDALKTIGVTLLDHIVVTPTGAVSFQTRGLL